MIDSDGDQCATSPPWVSEGPTECPGSSASNEPTYFWYSDPSVIETTGGVRIALRTRVSSVEQIEIVTLDLATSAVSYPEPLEGPSGVPQLVGDDSGAYLVWTDDFHSFGATLSADNVLGEVFEFGKITVKPLAVGDRFLVIEHDSERQQARWIEADGSVGAAFDFPGSRSAVLPRGGSASGGGVAATMFQRGTTTYVARTNGLDVEIAQEAGMGSIAVLPDGAILATYSKKLTPTGHADLHLVRIEPDGTATDEIAEWLRMRELVASGDRLFAISNVRSFEDITYRAVLLDPSGAVIGDEIEIFERDALIKVSMVPYQGDLVVLGAGNAIDATYFDGAPGTSVVIAESYEIDDGGCNAGSGAGLAIVLAFAGIRRRQRGRVGQGTNSLLASSRRP